MAFTWNRIGLPAAVFSVALAGAPFALAATGSAQGDTSGPASGTQTTPSAAVQKQAGNPAAAAAGAPGMVGKQGGESGVQPKASSSSDQLSKKQQ